MKEKKLEPFVIEDLLDKRIDVFLHRKREDIDKVDIIFINNGEMYKCILSEKPTKVGRIKVV